LSHNFNCGGKGGLSDGGHQTGRNETEDHSSKPIAFEELLEKNSSSNITTIRVFCCLGNAALTELKSTHLHEKQSPISPFCTYFFERLQQSIDH
jgi:hypothetical protein